MEIFWSTLKLDLVYRRDFATRHQVRTEIFDYIELFYNRQRIHTAIGGLSPTQFELKNNKNNQPFLLYAFSNQAHRFTRLS
jgi:transposase InsO family protein